MENSTEIPYNPYNWDRGNTPKSHTILTGVCIKNIINYVKRENNCTMKC